MEKNKQTQTWQENQANAWFLSETDDVPEVERTHKAHLFEMIFSEKKALLELYNAIQKTNYDDPNLLTINTLENAIYLSMRNDVSFVIGSEFHLYEHQSTYNPNLPLRFLQYVTKSYSKMLTDVNVYGRKRVLIPTPKFLVFYNGKEERPDVEEFKLSDSYEIQTDDPALELKATVLNINLGHNQELLNTCKTLKEYSIFVEKLRRYSEQMTVKQASLKAINECIQEGVLEEFLMENKAEVIYMNIFEYNEEKVLRMTKEEGYEMGYDCGYGSGYESGYLEGEIYSRCIDVREGDYSMERAAEKLDIPLEQFKYYYEEFVRTGTIVIGRN
jgi:hypothetical protein